MKNLNESGLYLMPLGGAEEVGFNCYIYAIDGKFIVVDVGYGFLNDEFPGVDMGMADTSFIRENKENILAFFITHAHEDHFGAIADSWADINCPVYAAAFTMGHIKNRLKDKRVSYDESLLKIVSDGEWIKAGAFDVQFISMVHAVPGNCGLFIKTKHGNVFHATDWKFDDGAYPELGFTNFAALEEAGREGVDMIVGDSTNIMGDGLDLNETIIRQTLIDLVKAEKNTLVATCFPSNVIRMRSLFLAAHEAGRTPVISGMSMINNMKIAKDLGYLEGVPNYVEARDSKDIPLDNVLYICAGSQGNYRSGLYNIVHEENKHVKLGKGDTIIFSSQIIPGNEKKIEDMQEKLRRRGVKIISKEEYNVHIGGHGGKREFEALYKILKPKMVVPVHGDRISLREHKRFANSLGIDKVYNIKNGELMLYKAEKLKHIDILPTNIIGIDRKMLTPLDSELIMNRKRAMFNCSLFISVVFSKSWKMIDLQVSSLDIMEENAFLTLIERVRSEIFEEIDQKVDKLKAKESAIVDYIRVKVRKAIYNETGIKPVVFMHFYKQD